MLSKELAQNICNKMMEVIPYNVNIMNDRGIIIGSGDKSRIGQVHEGALLTLEKKKVIEIKNNNGNTRAGVNSPIIFNKNIIGVIGITGQVDIVREFSKLVSVTAELLVTQEYNLNEHLIKKKIKEDFIYEWIYENKEYEEDIVQRALSMNIDIKLPRRVLILKILNNNYANVEIILNNILKKDEYFAKLISGDFLIIIKDEDDVHKKIELLSLQLNKFEIKVGIGRYHQILYHSMLEALEALKIGKKLFEGENIYYYEKIEVLDKIQEIFYIKEVENIIKNLYVDEKNKELLQTFITYMQYNGEVNITANKLHIHRNTLNYRLNRIEELTGKKLNNYLDLFELIASYISYRFN